MGRSGPEVADVFRRYGDAYREQHGESLSTAQRRVMTAIEICRTAALGGRVEQCDACGHQRISYCSCLMGKISNGESAAARPSLMLFVDTFPLHYRVIPEQGDQLVRRSEGPFTQMWWHDCLDRFELLGGISARIDFRACQGGMSQPK
jgi:hypothetical protein